MPEPIDPAPSMKARGLVAAWGATLLVLLAVTWRLWTPLREAPRVPPLAALSGLPVALDFACLAVVGLGVFRAARTPAHALLTGAVLATASPRRAIGVSRWITIAVYAYSALSKLDAEFAATLGQQLLNAASGGVGIDVSAWGETTRRLTVLLLPLGELAVAGLLIASTRRPRLVPYAVGAAVAMHMGVIGLLGPLGLGHSWGVLLWNVGFAWQTVVLFGYDLPEPTGDKERLPFFTWFVAAIGVLAPAFTPLGLWDQWPGWAVYAPGGERARLDVHEEAIDRLPASLRKHVRPSNDPSSWRRVALDDWLLAETGAPIYPQNRVVAAIAGGLAKRRPLSDRLRLVLETEAGRITRERESQTLWQTDDFLEASRLVGPVSPAIWTR